MAAQSAHKKKEPAFTLIELLVVISIIAVVAGLVVAAAGLSTSAKERKQTTVQLASLQLAIESYKTTFGTYPPVDVTATGLTGNGMINPLFYELTGTTYEPDPANPSSLTANRYRSVINQAHTLSVQQVVNAFGSKKVGFINQQGSNTFLNLKPERYALLSESRSAGTPTDVYLLRVPAGPISPSGTNKLNFWNYTAYNPNSRNPTGYDLWAVIRGKKVGETVTIGSWNSK